MAGNAKNNRSSNTSKGQKRITFRALLAGKSKNNFCSRYFRFLRVSHSLIISYRFGNSRNCVVRGFAKRLSAHSYKQFLLLALPLSFSLIRALQYTAAVPPSLAFTQRHSAFSSAFCYIFVWLFHPFNEKTHKKKHGSYLAKSSG